MKSIIISVLVVGILTAFYMFMFGHQIPTTTRGEDSLACCLMIAVETIDSLNVINSWQEFGDIITEYHIGTVAAGDSSSNVMLSIRKGRGVVLLHVYNGGRGILSCYYSSLEPPPIVTVLTSYGASWLNDAGQHLYQLAQNLNN